MTVTTKTTKQTVNKEPFMETIDGKDCIENTVTTKPQLRGLRPFKSGKDWNGNAKGRPKGSRNKLSERFLDDLRSVWEQSTGDVTNPSSVGRDAILAVAANDPSKLLSAMVQVLPKDFQVSVTDDSQGKWVINAQPMSIEDWQAEHSLLEAKE